MIVGGTGMLICHFTIAVIFAKNEHSWAEHKAAGWAAVAMVWLFVINFGYSWGRKCLLSNIILAPTIHFDLLTIKRLTSISMRMGTHQ